ncbi:MAG: restriction endonuclease subunit S [Lachnospiraceae bacterium]|nr:restriction endonuclease subunit S [Lachnospiraceae bacterium]
MGRTMKDSGVEWIGEIPDTWTISRIKYVADFEPKCDFSIISDDTNIEYAPMECIKCGQYEKRTARFGSLASSLTPFQDGDIVMAKVTPCFENGNIAIMDGIESGLGLGSSELFVFRAKAIEKEYLFFWLQNNDFIQQACATMTGTGGLKRVSPYFAKNCEIPLPPVVEQISIASFLKKRCAEIDSIIKKARISIEEYKHLKQAVTKGVRGERPMKESGIEWLESIPSTWKIVPIKYFTDILAGYAFSSDDFDINTGIPLLRGVNVTPKGIRWNDVVFWNKNVDEQLEAYMLRTGDLVLGLDRPWISEETRISWISEKDIPSLLLQRVCRIRVKDGILPALIYYWLSSPLFMETLSTDTTGINIMQSWQLWQKSFTARCGNSISLPGTIQT